MRRWWVHLQPHFKGSIYLNWDIWPPARFVKPAPPLIFSTEHTMQRKAMRIPHCLQPCQPSWMSSLASVTMVRCLSPLLHQEDGRIRAGLTLANVCRVQLYSEFHLHYYRLILLSFNLHRLPLIANPFLQGRRLRSEIASRGLGQYLNLGLILKSVIWLFGCTAMVGWEDVMLLWVFALDRSPC